jgi:hypothetical protein
MHEEFVPPWREGQGEVGSEPLASLALSLPTFPLRGEGATELRLVPPASTSCLHMCLGLVSCPRLSLAPRASAWSP